jgi:PAS domain S-box-containing protein
MLFSAVLFVLSLISPLYPIPLAVDENLTSEKMGPHIDYFIDPGGKRTVSEISSNEIQGKFQPLPKEDYGFGFTRDAVWLRLKVINPTDHDASWFLECSYPLIDDICVYVPKGNELSATCTGDRKPLNSRPLKYRTFVFPVSSPPGGSTCFARLATGGAMNISFTAWSHGAFQEKRINESIFLWMFYGIMIALAIYNLFIFISTRDLTYLFISLFTISMTLHSMSFNGLGFLYLWPFFPEWGNMANLVFNNFNVITAILFSRKFLDTRIKTPRYDRLLLACIVFVTATFIVIPFHDYYNPFPVITLTAGVIAVILVGYGMYQLARGSRPAKFYMVAWLCILLGIIQLVLHSFGLVHEGFLSTWGVQIGLSLLVILLSLGVVDKINTLRREREQALEDTREAEEKYRALIETTDTGYVIIDDRGKVLDANTEYVRLTGHLTLDDIINRSVTEWTSPADRERNAAAVESCMRQGFIRDLEIGYIQPDGKTVPIEINATVIESNEGSRILTLCRDITYRKTVFDNLQASLREKEVLLMEIHHRVKNNLQIISSLIALQAGKITDKEVLMLYEDLNSRIKAMSLIHERLYQSGDFARIDFAEYITIITSDLQSTYRLFCGNCSVEYDTDHIELDIVKAIPCGLMLNEIISNSFKYAFPATFAGHGTILISFHERDSETIELMVSDNGVGLPPSIDPEKKKTLGLSLIYLLAEQIQGTIRIDRAGGTTYTIIFRKT